MARGKKVVTTGAKNARDGIWSFIERDTSLPEEGKIPNFIYDGILGIYIGDVRNLELVKLKTVTVTEDNVKSVTTAYGDKYQIGDSFQEWGGLYGVVGCYPSSIAYALTKIKDIVIANELSKSKKDTDFTNMYKIIDETNKKIESCLRTDILPHGAEQADKVVKDLRSNLQKLEEVKEMYDSAKKEYESFMAELKERRRIIIKETTPKNK